METNDSALDWALFSAIKNGDLKKCEELLAQGASVEAIGSNGQSPLHEAAEFGHPEICRLLLSLGAKTDWLDRNEDIPLHLAIAKGGNVDVCRLLVPWSDIEQPNSQGFNALQIAAVWGQQTIAKYLIEEAGADIDVLADDERTLEFLAQEYKEPEMVAFLTAYRNSLKTERAICDALSAEETSSSATRSGGFSPL